MHLEGVSCRWYAMLSQYRTAEHSVRWRQKGLRCTRFDMGNIMQKCRYEHTPNWSPIVPVNTCNAVFYLPWICQKFYLIFCITQSHFTLYIYNYTINLSKTKGTKPTMIDGTKGRKIQLLFFFCLCFCFITQYATFLKNGLTLNDINVMCSFIIHPFQHQKSSP